jgi:DNA mismatch endonuclease, patch repair protein
MDRSENMKHIKSQDTSIELKLRKALWQRGYRYRKNCKDIFGKPDICFKSKKIAIFCDSEFWHGKNYLEKKLLPKTNTSFWKNKIIKNIQRDTVVNQKLKEEEWLVLRFWAKDINKNLDKCIQKIEKVLIGKSN